MDALFYQFETIDYLYQPDRTRGHLNLIHSQKELANRNETLNLIFGEPSILALKRYKNSKDIMVHFEFANHNGKIKVTTEAMVDWDANLFRAPNT